MIGIDDLSEKQRIDFCAMIDDLVLNVAPHDDELREGFRNLDEQANYYNISFYDAILRAYEESELRDRLDDWNNDRKS